MQGAIWEAKRRRACRNTAVLMDALNSRLPSIGERVHIYPKFVEDATGVFFTIRDWSGSGWVRIEETGEKGAMSMVVVISRVRSCLGRYLRCCRSDFAVALAETMHPIRMEDEVGCGIK